MERPRGSYSRTGRREGKHRNTRGAAKERWHSCLQRAGGRGGGGQRGHRRGTTVHHLLTHSSSTQIAFLNTRNKTKMCFSFWGGSEVTDCEALSLSDWDEVL